jgi:flagellar motor protein MotB
MVRDFMVTGALCLLVTVGCVSRQAHRAAMEELRSELSADKQGALDACQTRVAALHKQNKALQADLKTALDAVKTAQAATQKSRKELQDLRKKHDDLRLSLAGRIRDIPGAFVGKEGTLLATGFSFETGGSKLEADSVKEVLKLAEVLNERKGAVYVDGHTDNVPVKNVETKKRYVDNLGLSLARAAAVARVLTEAKIPAERLVVRGFGSSRPIASNKTAAGRAKNRRVEVRLVPPEGAKTK